MQFSDEVKLWEQVKVRVLNAGHLTLTYPALLLGYREVAEAMRDPQIPVLLERFLDKVVLPLLEAPRDVNLVDYKNTVLERFSNEAMHDQLTRIASDSASKVTVFLTTTLNRCSRAVQHHIWRSSLRLGAACCRARMTTAGALSVRAAADDTERRLLISGDPREALRVEPLLASGAAEHADFVATFGRYRKALASTVQRRRWRPYWSHSRLTHSRVETVSGQREQSSDT